MNQPQNAIESGATVLVARGRYMLHHGIIEEVRRDLGAHGFAVARFIGKSGVVLKRSGVSSLLPTGVLPPADLLPLTAMNVVEWPLP